MTTQATIYDLRQEIARPGQPIVVRQAMADAVIAVAAKAKAWPELHEAIDAKIADQREFVRWWDTTVRRKGGERWIDAADRGNQLSMADAETQAGISNQQVSRWRACTKTLESQEAYHDKLFDAARRAAKLAPADNYRAMGTGENEWFTPPQFIELARQAMGGIDLDPATHDMAQAAIQATQFFTSDDDALQQEWHGRIWLNPPYARTLIERFVAKLLAEIAAGRATQAIMLTHNYTETLWFQDAAKMAGALCFPKGRIKFTSPDGEESNPTQGQAFFYYGPHAEMFAQVFRGCGLVLNTAGV